MSRQKAYREMNAGCSLIKKISSREKYIFIAAAFLIFFAAGTALSMAAGTESTTSQGEVVTRENVSDILSRLEKSDSPTTTEDDSYYVVMTSTWTFDTGSSVSRDAYVENSTDNRNTIYFTVTLHDGKMPIYVSPLLPVGSSVSDIRLDASLASGTYDALLTYYLLDENNKCVSEIPMKLEINVEH